MGVSTQTRFDTTLNGAISDVDTALVLDDAPAFTKGYGTLERGTVNEEDVYWDNLSGLQLTSMLRGLSKTALTNTEVSGNKKAHLDGAVFEATLLHYIVNDKASKSGDETISGQWAFTQLPTSSDTPSGATDFVTKGYTDTADALKANLAGGNTWTGAQSFTGATAIFADSGAETLTNAAPTSDKKLANKKYVDDTVTSGLASNSVVNHLIYTPAFLTGGASPTNNYLLWLGTSNGSFRFTLNGVLRDVTGIDFTTGVTSMNDVASKIQTAIRALTGGLETCTWDGSKFIISSADTSTSSAITVLSATGSGTDISGAGATSFMDSDTGNGTVTNKALNPTADAGKIVKTAADGFIDGTPSSGVIPDLFLRYSTVTTKGDLIAATGSGVMARFGVGANETTLVADSSQSNGLKYAFRSRLVSASAADVTVTGTTAETNLYQVSIPANTLGTSNVLKMTLHVQDLDLGVDTRTTAIVAKYGSTAIGSFSYQPPAGGTTVNGEGTIVATLMANGATNAQVGILETHAYESTGLFSTGLEETLQKAFGTATENSTTALNFTVTAQHNNNGNNIVIRGAILELIA
jgi:hypothetical protein